MTSVIKVGNGVNMACGVIIANVVDLTAFLSERSEESALIRNSKQYNIKRVKVFPFVVKFW